MDSEKATFIHERSNIIPIKNNNNIRSCHNKIYDLKTNFFDPSKGSPPNDFLLKLNKRIHFYEHKALEKNNFNLTKT
jgi:hypothetical protein